MDKLDAFKEFVKENPSLIQYVKTNEMTWQKFYEMYDLYGTEDNIWKPYLNFNNDRVADATTSAIGTMGFNEIVDWIKNIDIATVQSAIDSVQRVVSVLQDFTSKNKEESPKEEYKPRPLYKNFED